MIMAQRIVHTTVGAIDPETLAYTTGRDPVLDLALVRADCLGTAAHALMLSRMRPPILTGEETRRLIEELKAVLALAAEGRFTITLADQDVHLAIERHLTSRLGETGKKVHTFRSRNDQAATDLRLYLREELLALALETLELAETFCRFGRRHDQLPMVGRTHRQPAMPSTVGLWAGAHAESLADDLRDLLHAYDLNDACPLGSAASYGVPAPIDRHLTARLLGFSSPVHNVLYANNSRGKIEARTLAACGQVMLSLSRAAEDLIFFTLPEIGYFSLPEFSTTGSSIMPQKRNPDVCELVRARAARVWHQALLAAEIVRGLPSGYNRELQETKPALIEGLADTRASVRVLIPVIRQLRVHPDALRRGFEPSVFATDAVLERVAAGVPFRDAYHQVKEGLAELSARDPAEAVARKTHWGAPAGLDWEWVRRFLASSRREVRRRLRRVEQCWVRLLPGAVRREKTQTAEAGKEDRT